MYWQPDRLAVVLALLVKEQGLKSDFEEERGG